MTVLGGVRPAHRCCSDGPVMSSGNQAPLCVWARGGDIGPLRGDGPAEVGTFSFPARATGDCLLVQRCGHLQ